MLDKYGSRNYLEILTSVIRITVICIKYDFSPSEVTIVLLGGGEFTMNPEAVNAGIVNVSPVVFYL